MTQQVLTRIIHKCNITHPLPCLMSELASYGCPHLCFGCVVHWRCSVPEMLLGECVSPVISTCLLF